MLPGPSRRLFGLFLVYRWLLTGVITWVVWEAPFYHVSLPIGWPLVGFLVLYDGLLWGLWRSVDFAVWGSLLSLLALGLDTLIAGLILLEFAYPTSTDSPVFLPLLVFEGWTYWNWVGGLVTLAATELLLLGTWFYQKVVGHAAFSPALLVFWAITLVILSTVPMSVAQPAQTATTAGSDHPEHADDAREDDPVAELTEREREVYQHLKQAHSVTEIAQSCHIEPTTVKTHIRNIYRKLGISEREQLP
jgi:DNA-binding CsgD family transcriptional regulator